MVSRKLKSNQSKIISAGLLEIYGLGVLILGDSGVGKSESALELITRGHRFVSDDVVLVEKTKAGKLRGKAPEVVRNFMELRGLGLINIREIFGQKAICPSIQIDLAINLRRWHRGDEFDRIGLEFPEDYEILGVKIPQIIIPVAPGRNIATLIEIACRVHRLRQKGYLAPQEMVKRLEKRLK
jgi:HPr kinase/phosphorylase